MIALWMLMNYTILLDITCFLSLSVIFIPPCLKDIKWTHEPRFILSNNKKLYIYFARFFYSQYFIISKIQKYFSYFTSFIYLSFVLLTPCCAWQTLPWSWRYKIVAITCQVTWRGLKEELKSIPWESNINPHVTLVVSLSILSPNQGGKHI
jgi:hypothetical protein